MPEEILTFFLLSSSLIQKIYSKPLEKDNSNHGKTNLKVFIVILLLFIFGSILYFTRSFWLDTLCFKKSKDRSIKDSKLLDLDMDISDEIYERIEYDSINFPEIKGYSRLSIDITSIFDKYINGKNSSYYVEVDSFSHSDISKHSSKSRISLNNSINILKTQEISEADIPEHDDDSSYIDNIPSFLKDQSDQSYQSIEVSNNLLVDVNGVKVDNNVDVQSLKSNNNNNIILDDSIKSKKSVLSKHSQNNEEDSINHSGLNMNDEKALVSKSLKPLNTSESSIEIVRSNTNQESLNEPDSDNAHVFNTPLTQSITSDEVNDTPTQILEKEKHSMTDTDDSVITSVKIKPINTNDNSMSSLNLDDITDDENQNNEKVIDGIPDNENLFDDTNSNNDDAIVKDKESEVSIEINTSDLRDEVDDKSNDLVDGPIYENEDKIDTVINIVEPVPESEKVEENIESVDEPEKVEEKIETVDESEKVEEKIETVDEPEKIEEKIETIDEPEKVEEKIVSEDIEENNKISTTQITEPEPISEGITESKEDENLLEDSNDDKKAEMEIIKQKIQAVQQSMENDITNIKLPVSQEGKMVNHPPLLNKRSSSLNLNIKKKKDDSKSSSKKGKHHKVKKIQQSIDEEIQSIANEIKHDPIKEKFNDYIERRSSIQSDVSSSSKSSSSKKPSALSAYILNENSSEDNTSSISDAKAPLSIDITENELSKESEVLSPLSSHSSLSSSQLHSQLRSPTPPGNNRVHGNCVSPSPSLASTSDSIRDQCISPTPSEESAISSVSSSYSVGKINRNKQFEVLYDHKPQLPDEIPLKKGDLVQLKQVFEDGWAYGIVKNKRLDGIFPIQCLGEEVEPVRNQRMVPRLVRVYQARLEDEEQKRQEEEEFKRKVTDQARKNLLLKLALSHPK